jgi:hypothetical protein
MSQPKGEGLAMEYVCFDKWEELEKAAKGKKTKVDLELLLYLVLNDYPAIQRNLGKAFGIREHPSR